MKIRRRFLSLLLTAVMCITFSSGITVSAAEGDDGTTNGATMDFAEFVKAVTDGGGTYDGQGVTVTWSPSSACTDNRDGHACTADNKEPDGNNAQRIQKPNAQYQVFGTLTDISISNVNFEFVPADFTLCMNNQGWSGSVTADEVRNAEFQMQNTGNVTFTNCSFDKVIISPYGTGSGGDNANRTLTVTGCKFNNVYDAYAIKDIYPASASITGNSFDHCSGGIYFEGNSTKKAITITDNTFTNMDEYAAEDKVGTRGLIQFSASGVYTTADIDIADNTSTGDAAVLRQLNHTVTASVLDFDTLMESNSFAGEVLTDSTYGTNTVYYNGATYATLAEALKGVYMSTPTETAKVYCKADADVGTLTHGHVADDIIIYGNGAVISGGEGDIEIDTYKYSRETGVQAQDGSYLDKDITVKVYDLDGIAAWGQRNTDKTINLVFENCQNMDRIYFTNTANDEGKINITLNDCSFDGNKGSNTNTSVYSNAAGDINITNTSFKNIVVGLNINHKSAGVQNITLDNCVFEDCSLPADAEAANASTYAAPIRIVTRNDATTNLIVKNVEIVYTDDNTNCGNGDILLGDGRYDANEQQGKITLSMNGTAAEVVTQQAGYYGDNGAVADTAKSQTYDVAETDTVTTGESGEIIVDDHSTTKLVGQKDATCTEEGYTGDKVCAVCGKVVEQGKVIEKLAHNYEDGKCTVCGATDPDYEPSEPEDKPTDSDDGKTDTPTGGNQTGNKDNPDTGKTDSPKTGDNRNILPWIAVLLVSGATLTGTAFYSRKRKYNR